MLIKVKLALAITGLILFAIGVRVDDMRIRWVGIALVIAAFLLRFFRPRPEPR